MGELDEQSAYFTCPVTGELFLGKPDRCDKCRIHARFTKQAEFLGELNKFLVENQYLDHTHFETLEPVFVVDVVALQEFVKKLIME